MSEIIKAKTKVCIVCMEELPLDAYKPGSPKCKRCVAEYRIDGRMIERTRKRNKKEAYKLTELDKIAIKCQELGISYGEYQQRERQGRL